MSLIERVKAKGRRKSGLDGGDPGVMTVEILSGIETMLRRCWAGERFRACRLLRPCPRHEHRAIIATCISLGMPVARSVRFTRTTARKCLTGVYLEAI